MSDGCQPLKADRWRTGKPDLRGGLPQAGGLPLQLSKVRALGYLFDFAIVPGFVQNQQRGDNRVEVHGAASSFSRG